MNWAPASRRRHGPGTNFTILAPFSLPASELKPELLPRPEEYERSILRNSGSRDAPVPQTAFPARPGTGSPSRPPGKRAARLAGRPAWATGQKALWRTRWASKEALRRGQRYGHDLWLRGKRHPRIAGGIGGA